MALGHLGAYYAKKGQYDRAITNCTEAIRLNPKYATAFFYRGYSWQMKTNLNRALEDFEMAAKLDPNEPDFKKYLEIARSNSVESRSSSVLRSARRSP